MSERPISFRRYLARRGYDLQAGSGAFFRRMFLSAWAEPGFHRFWRVWNPLYGYCLFRLYLSLGGSRQRLLATVTVFVASGLLLHDLPVALIRGHVQVTVTAAFLGFAALTLLSRSAERLLGFPSWPRPAHVVLNLALVVAGLVFGAWVQGQLVGA